MVYGLPERGDPEWDVKLGDSIEAVKATADAAQPADDLEADVASKVGTDGDLDDALATSIETVGGEHFAAKDSPEITGDATIERVGYGEGASSVRVPSFGQFRMVADDIAATSPGGSIVGEQRTIIYSGDWTVKATVTITATGGTADWSIGGQTATIAFDATAGTVQTALTALSTVGASNLTVTGGPGGTASYVVAYKPKWTRDGYRELTIDGTNLTGPSHSAAISWRLKETVDTGIVFGGNDYTVTSNVSGDGGIAFLYGRISEVAVRNDGLYGSVIGTQSEVSWSGANGTGSIARMIGHHIIVGRHKNDAGAGFLAPDGVADEAYGLYVDGVPEGRTVTDAVTTNGSAVVTSATARFLTLAHRGRKVTGTGIPANAYIVSVDSATQVTLSANCTASGTITMTLANIAGSTTARTATFGYGTVEFQGRTDHKPSYKNEAAARLFAYPGAADGDVALEQYAQDGTTRKLYTTVRGGLAGKSLLAANESAADGQVIIGAQTSDGGSWAAVSFGTAADAIIYRPGSKQLSLLADGSFRTGRAVTGSRPTATSRGAGAQFFDLTLNKPIWSDGTVWRDAAGTAV